MKFRFVIALLLTLPMLSYAGVDNAYRGFVRFDLSSAQSALESKKSKFDEAEYAKLVAELKDAEAIMSNSKGMRREEYYQLTNEQTDRVMKIKAIADAKQ
jgi:hypothetical protein